LFNRYLR